MWRSTSILLLITTLIAAVGCGSSGTSGSGSKITSSPSSNPASSGSGPADAISIYPAGDVLRIGGQRQFSGFDTTVGQYDVSWSLQEGATGGSVTAGGLYTAPSTTGTFHLIATSMANPKITAAAAVKIVPVGFVPSGDMAIARSGHTATSLRDGSVLVAGGTANAAHSAELFIPALSSFTEITGAMIHVRFDHCAALLQDGRVLIAGGDNRKGTVFSSAELFDPATQSFVATGELNQARKGATATLLSNGKVLIAGGQGTGGALSSAELYDPVARGFSLTENMQAPRTQHTATLLSDGKVLLLGNIDDTSSAELFDPATGRFTATGSLVQARAHHTATLLPSGKVLVVGGTQVQPPGGGGAGSAPVSLDSVEIYDPASGKFKSAGMLAVARDSHSATLLANGTVLVAGGYSHGFDGDAQPEWFTMFTAEQFDPTTSVWTPAASLEVDRAGHVAALLNNGQVLVTGGIKGFLQLCCHPQPFMGSLSSAELYK
ncbi:MAG TPA: kelch repeat-containing protein [Terriglobales bacterium]|nr:kelch repeat-containing protein [Terriglobales bacterium]